MSYIVTEVLRAVSSALQIPTIIILILLILLTVVMLGSFVAEIFSERKSLKMNIPKLVDELQGKSSEQMKEVINKSGLLKRQKAAVQELISRPDYADDTREALARQLIADEESRYAKITKITDLTARVAPMFGLMGTLIPLGPGLIALGEGDAATLAESLLIAFDTTVAGLISGAVSYVISGIRKGWYEEYMIGLETIMETVLDVQTNERVKAQQTVKTTKPAQPKTAQTVPAQPVQNAQPVQTPQMAQNVQPAAPKQSPAQPSPSRQAMQQTQNFQSEAVAEAARKRAAVEAQQEAARMQAMAARQEAARRQAQMDAQTSPAANENARRQAVLAAQQEAARRQAAVAAQQEAARRRAAVEAQQENARMQAAAQRQSSMQQRPTGQMRSTDDMSFDELLHFFETQEGGRQ